MAFNFKNLFRKPKDTAPIKQATADFAAINRDTLLSYTIEQCFGEIESGFCKFYKQVEVKFGSFEEEFL